MNNYSLLFIKTDNRHLVHICTSFLLTQHIKFENNAWVTALGCQHKNFDGGGEGGG